MRAFLAACAVALAVLAAVAGVVRQASFKVAIPAGYALAAARIAPGAATLDQLERDADATFDAIYAHGIKDELSASALTSFNLGLSELHRSIAARRAALAAG